MFNINKFFKNKEERVGGYPRIIYDDVVFKRYMASWAKFVGCQSTELMLLNLGFKPEDKIYLYADGYDMVYYSVNEDKFDENNRINLQLHNPVITIYNSKNKISYSCITDKESENGFVFHKTLHEKKLSNELSVVCQYYLLNCGYEFRIINGEDVLDLVICLNDNVSRELGSGDELEKYLTNLEFPISIEDVYKKVCEISLVNVEDCLTFKLEVSKKIDEHNKVVTDLISFENGKFVEFGITKNGRRVFFVNDGNWSYEKIDDNSVVKFSMKVRDNNISYNVSSDNMNELDDYTKTLAGHDINAARSGAEEVKTLVRSLLIRK